MTLKSDAQAAGIGSSRDQISFPGRYGRPRAAETALQLGGLKRRHRQCGNVP